MMMKLQFRTAMFAACLVLAALSFVASSFATMWKMCAFSAAA